MKKIYTQTRTETVANTPQKMLCASGGIKAQISGYKTGSSFTQPVIIGVICSSLLMLGTACSTNNPDQPKQQAELKPRTLIVQTSPQPSPQERGIQRLPQATITENEGVLDAIWNEGDAVFYRNLSHNEFEDTEHNLVPLFGTLYADKAERIASFTGDRVWCDEPDQLALIYPNNPANFTFHENPLTASYTISVAGQDGSLETLASTYHHIYGIASVVSVTGTTANAELAEMKSLMTVCKFSFVDETAPSTPLPISSLEISYGGGGLNDGKYPQKGTVSIAQNQTTRETEVEQTTEATLTSPLTITPAGNPTEVYVALFPHPEQPYKFTVTSTTGNTATDGTYTGEATATLNEGEYVVAPLKLTKNNN